MADRKLVISERHCFHSLTIETRNDEWWNISDKFAAFAKVIFLWNVIQKLYFVIGVMVLMDYRKWVCELW